MKNSQTKTKRDSSILSTSPDLRAIGFNCTKNGIIRPIKNRARK